MLVWFYGKLFQNSYFLPRSLKSLFFIVFIVIGPYKSTAAALENKYVENTSPFRLTEHKTNAGFSLQLDTVEIFSTYLCILDC